MVNVPTTRASTASGRSARCSGTRRSTRSSPRSTSPPAGLEGAKHRGDASTATPAARRRRRGRPRSRPRYAPSIDIVGVAAGGNFPDLDYTTQHFDNSIWYGTEIGVLESFSRALPQDFDLSKLLNASGQALAAKDGQDGSGCAGSTLNEPLRERLAVHELPRLRGAGRLPAGQARSRGAEPEERTAAEGPAVPLQLGRRRPRVHPAGRRVGCRLLPARRDRRLRPRPARRRSPQRGSCRTGRPR